MTERIIEIEADTVKDARRKLNTNELIVLEELILCYGRVENIEASADTVEEAFTKAQGKVPAGAKIETQNIKIAPKRVTLQVQGDNEESAGKGKAEVIASVSLLTKGRRGFWGLGKTPNVYEVVIFQPAVVELRFRERAKIRVKVRGYLAEDLLQSIQEARQRNAHWTETLRFLNPKNDSEIQESLTKIRELNPNSALDTIEVCIENFCRKNEKANWQMIIREAHRQAALARARELREQEAKLRGLDVEVAEAFMFYTSIDWYEKHYVRRRREPTGLPRGGYDENVIVKKNKRQNSLSFFDF